MSIADFCVRMALQRVVASYAQVLQIRLDRYRTAQQTLSDTYAVSQSIPQGYTEQLRTDQHARYASAPDSSVLLRTSGTTSRPKEVWYPDDRIVRVQREFILQVLMLGAELPLSTPSFYFLTSLRPSSSLSSALLRVPQLAWAEHLALSQSTVFAPRAVALSERVPELWVHIAYLLLTRPAVVVAANPSSVLGLLYQAQGDWERGRAVVRRILPEVWSALSMVCRHASGGKSLYAEALARTDGAPLEVPDLFPRLEAIVCWTGGYVEPYIRRLRVALEARAVRILPLLSISTEELLGLNLPGQRDGSCVPLAEGVVYEFIREHEVAPAPVIMAPWELQVGERYCMIISNQYGFRRYNTSDIFVCTGMVHNTPLLRFVGRSGLQHSFSGEKLTAEHLLEAYQRAYARAGRVLVDTLCFPEAGVRDELPHYVFLVTTALDAEEQQRLAVAIDTALSEVNDEYRGKRESGRIGAPRLHSRELAQVIQCLGRRAGRGTDIIINRAQVKVLPLYPNISWAEMERELRGE